MANSSILPVERLGQDPPVVDWLVALSHDSPFERPQAGAARGGASPPLAAVSSLLSLMKDSDRGVRARGGHGPGVQPGRFPAGDRQLAQGQPPGGPRPRREHG